MTPDDALWMVIGINTALAFAQVALIVRSRRLNVRARGLLLDAEPGGMISELRLGRALLSMDAEAMARLLSVWQSSATPAQQAYFAELVASARPAQMSPECEQNGCQIRAHYAVPDNPAGDVH
jgi:hypothetical protein